VTGNLPVPIENGRSASLSIRNGAWTTYPNTIQINICEHIFAIRS
jgi:hypothetical protein